MSSLGVEPQVISRDEARSRGLKFFFRGQPCARGHIDVWYVSTDGCKSCARENDKKQKVRRRSDPELRQIDATRQKQKYWSDPQKFRDRANSSRKPMSGGARLADAVRRKRQYHENIDREKSSRKVWRAENYEMKKTADAEWQRENPERVKARNKRWQEKNKDSVRSFTRNYRAKKRAAPGSHTGGDILALFERQRGLCACGCNSDISSGYEVDHIIPISRGGENWPSNLQLLRPRCNKSKNDKTMEEWMTTRGAASNRVTGDNSQ